MNLGAARLAIWRVVYAVALHRYKAAVHAQLFREQKRPLDQELASHAYTKEA
jgi:hypothetical protein